MKISKEISFKQRSRFISFRTDWLLYPWYTSLFIIHGTWSRNIARLLC